MLDTITSRGFEPRATSIAARTIGGCYQMCFYPDTRPLIGLAVFSVTPTPDGHCFSTEARVLGEGELPETLLGWLEDRIPSGGAIISWDHWLSLPARLSALASDRHPRTGAAAGATDGRWRDLPRSLSWHLRHAQATAMPCLCGPGEVEPCHARLPTALLPEPRLTEQTLAEEAMRGWATWARLFADFDDTDHPAQRALAAARGWSAHRATAAG
jgi:hypothetical protein